MGDRRQILPHLPLAALPLRKSVPVLGAYAGVWLESSKLEGGRMRIGVPREIKVHEYRVGLVPAGVRELVGAGHEVIVETGAGNGIGVDDAQYRAAGASIAQNAADVFARGELFVKVKDPQLAECEMLRPGHIL